MKTLNASVMRVFDQDQVWTANGHGIRIEDMDARYRKTVVAWLERQVGYLVWEYHKWKLEHYLYSEISPDPESQAFESLSDALENEFDAAIADPEAWLHSTKLVKALEAAA